VTIAGLDHLAITVADVERTFTWYRQVLGAGVLYETEWRAGTIPVVSLQSGHNRINVHAAAAPAAPHAVAPPAAARLIASGVLASQADEAAAAWTPLGFVERERRVLEGWAALVLERAA
jgi:catechol 2,3-dioxygenase-like lactoylglutathione lyase family enzyme